MSLMERRAKDVDFFDGERTEDPDFFGGEVTGDADFFDGERAEDAGFFDGEVTRGAGGFDGESTGKGGGFLLSIKNRKSPNKSNPSASSGISRNSAKARIIAAQARKILKVSINNRVF